MLHDDQVHVHDVIHVSKSAEIFNLKFLESKKKKFFLENS